MRIYLLSAEGCAYVDDSWGLKGFLDLGYRRCTKDEYHKRMRQIRAKENAEAVAERRRWKDA